MTAVLSAGIARAGTALTGIALTGLGFAGLAPAAVAAGRVPAPAITAPASGSTVVTATPRLAGRGQPRDTVIASEAGLILCVATVTPAGRWACTSTSPLKNGAHHVTATQTNSLGVMSGASATLNLRVRAHPVPSVPITTTAHSPSGHPSAGSAAPSSHSNRNEVLAVIAVLALVGTLGVGAYLRLRPPRRG